MTLGDHDDSKLGAKPTNSSRPVALAGLRVLVVDDEEDARDLLDEILTRAGCVVTVAGSAADALRCVRELSPDVIVSDVGMPGEDGYTLMRKVRALGSDVPSIAVTAYTRASDRYEALRAGFSVHLPKPVRVPDLLATILSFKVPKAPS